MPGIAGTTAGGPGALDNGGRARNVVRHQFPGWSGFNFKVAYVRPSDGNVPTTTSTAAPNVTEGTKNKAILIAPQFVSGGIIAGFSYWEGSVIVSNAKTLFANA